MAFGGKSEILIDLKFHSVTLPSYPKALHGILHKEDPQQVWLGIPYLKLVLGKALGKDLPSTKANPFYSELSQVTGFLGLYVIDGTQECPSSSMWYAWPLCLEILPQE